MPLPPAVSYSLRAPILQRPEWNGPGPAPEEFPGAERTRIAQFVCAATLWVACLVAIMMIFREAIGGLHRSFYCSVDGQQPNEEPAPELCAVPLAFSACLCNLTVVVGLWRVLRFAWCSTRLLQEGPEFSTRLQPMRAQLQLDLTAWRSVSAKVLVLAGFTYLVAGAPCAGMAKLALVFLATGFITLYATALFFDDFEQSGMSPRLLRFLLVYILVGLTFTALASGATERVQGRRQAAEVGLGASIVSPQDASHFADVCTSLGRQQAAPPQCTVPLDFISGVSLWWAASPVFSLLLPARHGRIGGGVCRGFLQRWRKYIDMLILAVALLLLVTTRHSPLSCSLNAPIAFGNAELGVWSVSLLALLRRVSPLACDGWRGPLSHLLPSQGVMNPPQCPICLQELIIGEDICRTPCDHDFHRDCLEDWVLSRRYAATGCPLCRESLMSESTDPSRILLADCFI